MLQHLIKICVFLAAGSGLGYCSAQTAIVYGLGVTEVKNGAWTAWPAAGSPTADPYTRAHFAYTGELPLSSFEAVIFRAVQDNTGNPLVTNCDYVVEGAPLDVRWWNMTVYAENGTLIANPAQRYSFNSDNILLSADGSFRIALSSTAKPGNWIPTGEAHDDFFISLRLFGPSQDMLNKLKSIPVPKITRGKCK